MKTRFKSMFLFLTFLSLLFCVSVHKVYASTNIATDITADTVWNTTGSPYIVSGQINVATGTTLTVSPGVVVLFDYDSEIDVSGNIIANGTSDNTIYFTSIADTTLNGATSTDEDPDLTIPPVAGDYGGFVFTSGSTGTFQNIEMRYAENAIFVNTPPYDSKAGSLSVSNSVFINNQIGIFMVGGSLNLANTTFSNNTNPLKVDLMTTFIHAGNVFNNNTNNAIELYGSFYHSGYGYDITLDGAPYFLSGELYVSGGGKLTVEAGVHISGKVSYSSFHINNGTLNILGTDNQRVSIDAVAIDTENNSHITLDNLDFNSRLILLNSTFVCQGSNFISSSDDFQSDFSTLDINDSTFVYVPDTYYSDFSGSALFIADGTATLKNITVDGFSYGIELDNSALVVDSVSINNCGYGLLLYESSNVHANDLSIKNSTIVGIFSDSEPGDTDGNGNPIGLSNNLIQLRHSEISNNSAGILIADDTDVDIRGSSIHHNQAFGLYVNVSDFNYHDEHESDEWFNNYYNSLVNISGNWWGDESGPYNADTNQNGNGDKVVTDPYVGANALGGCPKCVSQKSQYQPTINLATWLKRDPTIPQKTPVLIVPGVLGTEISQSQSDGTSEKLWLDLAHNLTDIGDDFMDPLQFNNDLTPTDTSLVLGDVIQKVYLLGGSFDYSDSLIKDFDNQGYVEGTDLFVFPYDWRYGVSDDTVAQLKQKITDIMNVTGSDKVDVVAHSTGGLLVKKYVMDNPTTHSIDKAVFVGVPNTGAPKAIKTLLVGDNFDNLFLADSEMQKIARNLPVVYDLAPSAEYFKDNGSFIKTINVGLFDVTHADLSFDDMDSFLVDTHHLNSQAWTNAKNLHTSDFDNYDIRTAGVDVYAIDGCRSGTMNTIGQVVETTEHSLIGNLPTVYDSPTYTSGDGTVPLGSSTHLPINDLNKYYALQAEHGEMLSADGVRQQIVGIVASTSTIINPDLITQDGSKCELNGRVISIYSPLSIDITDQSGNHSGLSLDGVSIENNIPNADYEIMGEHKFVYLPTDSGQRYVISVAGTGDGVFTLTDATISNSTTTSMQVFSQVPVTNMLKGVVNIGNTTTIVLDTNGDGVVDKTLQPTTTLSGTDAQNFDPIVFANSGSSGAPVSLVVRRNSAHSVVVQEQVSPMASVATSTVVQSLIQTPVSEISKIEYNTQATVNDTVKGDAGVNLKQKDSVSVQVSSSTLAALVERSKTPVSSVAVWSSLIGIVGLAFIGRKFIK